MLSKWSACRVVEINDSLAISLLSYRMAYKDHVHFICKIPSRLNVPIECAYGMVLQIPVFIYTQQLCRILNAVTVLLEYLIDCSMRSSRVLCLYCLGGRGDVPPCGSTTD